MKLAIPAPKDAQLAAGQIFAALVYTAEFLGLVAICLHTLHASL